VAAWLLMAHRVPRDPTVHRVGIWRKLKRLGAILLHDSVWVLPANARTREHFRWLAAEIEEAGGKAMIWESSTIVHGDEDDLRRRFLERVEPGYSEILGELKNRPDDVEPLARRYRQLREHDYFDSATGHRVRNALMAAKGEPRK
jgi:hypothetical protein